MKIKHLKIVCLVSIIVLIGTLTTGLYYGLDGIDRYEEKTFTVSGKIFQITPSVISWNLKIVNYTEQKEYSVFIDDSLMYERDLGEPFAHRVYEIGDNVTVTYYRQWYPRLNVAIVINK